ncbi:hypothetical protein ACFWEO_33700 [Streptomyces roseolus]|uniref:hypothetical protein n=1 Tax=Streptomyces roseolus TaxID=67358 RepID=UPI0036597770
MDTHVLSLRMDSELFERLRGHAARRGMSVQDYVVRTMIRDDFDQRFQTAVEETEKFYGDERVWSAERRPSADFADGESILSMTRRRVVQRGSRGAEQERRSSSVDRPPARPYGPRGCPQSHARCLRQEPGAPVSALEERVPASRLLASANRNGSGRRGFPRHVRGQNIGALDLLAHLTPAAPSS